MSTTTTTTGPQASTQESTKPKPPTSEDLIWYTALCHCKAIHYRTRLPRKLKVMRCTCSICTKLGYLLVYPLKQNTEWISGYDTLVNYRMGPKTQDHKFCPGCGASVGIDSMREFWRFNMRLFKGFHGLDVEFEDGDGVAFNEEFNDKDLM